MLHALGPESRQQVFQRRIDNVRLERPDDLILGEGIGVAGWLLCDRRNEHGREARVGDQNEVLRHFAQDGAREQFRRAFAFNASQRLPEQSVLRRDEKEGVLRYACEF